MPISDFRAPIAVSLGAVGGALSRYYLGLWLVESTGLADFPLGTLTANLLGCFLMGVFIALTFRHETMSSEVRLLVATGFLGSLTTFSSYQLDTAVLLDSDGWQQDLLYWLGSFLLGLACWYGGFALGEARGERNKERKRKE